MNPELPPIILGGGTKCGTTSVYHHLGRVPGVAVPAQKELKLFSIESPNLDDLDEYLSWFPQGGIRFDVSPGYLYRPSVVAGNIERFYKHQPLPKLVFLLRDPVDRMISHYLHCCRLGGEKRSLAEVVEAIQRDVEGHSEIHARDWSRNHYSESLFGKWSKRWCEVYPRENIFFYDYRVFARDCRSLLEEVCALGGLALPDDLSFDRKFNQASEERSKILGKSLGNPSPFLHRMSLLIPKRLRRRLKQQMREANSKAIEKPPFTVERERLRELFEEDLELLNSEVGFTFLGEGS